MLNRSLGALEGATLRGATSMSADTEVYAMARLPFPDDFQGVGRGSKSGKGGRTGSGGSGADRTLTVSEVATAVKAALADSLPRPIRVVGQVSNLSKRTHWFFSLKDAGAAMRCVCFATAARKVGFPLTDGMS